jgi:hypothetical protein
LKKLGLEKAFDGALDEKATDVEIINRVPAIFKHCEVAKKEEPIV